MPGGKMRFHESFEETCHRETLEETGLEINTSTIKIISITNDMVSDKHFVTIGFLSEDVKGEPQVLEPDEITQWQRFDLNELPTPLFFPSEKVIKNYFAGSIYNY
ncbi:MAG: NUDIX domain-containing protein [bacterium]